MFAIVYVKATKKIVHVRYDYSVPQTLTASDCFAQYVKGSGVNAQDYAVAELPYDDDRKIIVGNHVYNESTGQVEADPSYVEPAPAVVSPAPAPME